MHTRAAILCCLLSAAIFSSSQNLTQTIKGTVIDKDSRRPLAGATVSIADDSVKTNVLTDEQGNFLLTNIPVGRRSIQCSFSGYENYITDNIILNSAKELELLIELEQHYKQQTEVVVKAVRNPKQPVNKLAVVSTRSFTPEETNRYAASVNDPSRMALSFPGVQPTRDARSDIVIRGNSAAVMLWRLEGIDIPNPNHFARKGSSGGGITIFSSSMLDNSDFSSGAFPAEYGDALSGVFDMHFRKGNKEKDQYTFKAGIIGIDFSAEGPFEKGKSSYLVNYRYSTLGILNTLGFHLTDEREDNRFQDLSFNLNFPSKNNLSVFNIWGIGGLSKEDYSEIEDVTKWDEYDDYAIYDFKTNMGAAGIGHSLQIGKTGLLKTSLAIMDQKISFVDDTLNKQKTPYTINDELYKNSRLSLAISYNTKIGSSVNWKTGAFISRIGYRFQQSLFDFNTVVYRNNIIDGEGNTFLYQPFTQLNIKINPKLTFNPGIHVLYLALNKTRSIEPRASFQYRINPNHSVSLALGQHGKTLPLGSYFYKAPNGSFPNVNLKMMKSAHFVAAYDWLMKKNWRFHIEGYLQKLTAIPVVNDVNRTFWLLNMIDGYANEALVNGGTGKNKGVDITLEKFFSKGWFMLTGFSVFNSTYSPLNGKTYNTQYNSRTAGSFTAGREWKWKKEKTFVAGGKMLYNGGMPISPLLAGAPVNSRKPVLDETRPYSQRVPSYFRTDARISLRKDKTKAAWMLALDIQNLFGIKNTDALSRRYDPSINQWIYKKSSGFVPVISYQLDF
ncbi:MAG: carboxypeptidase regulatory-like domain-containing protein [Chitinophagaceae bacterium]